MSRWTGERVGRLSLGLDAAYCTILGAIMTFAAPAVATALPLPAWAVASIGIAVILWAGLIMLMIAKLPIQLALRIVMVANLFAAVAVAAVSVLGAAILVALAALTIAIDIALFAGSQAYALRRLRLKSS